MNSWSHTPTSHPVVHVLLTVLGCSTCSELRHFVLVSLFAEHPLSPLFTRHTLSLLFLKCLFSLLESLLLNTPNNKDVHVSVIALIFFFLPFFLSFLFIPSIFAFSFVCVRVYLCVEQNRIGNKTSQWETCSWFSQVQLLNMI